MNNCTKKIKNTKLQMSYLFVLLNVFTTLTGHLKSFTSAKQQKENANFLLKHEFSMGVILVCS